MMKKLICMMLLVAVLLVQSGCSVEQSSYRVPVKFYYPEAVQADGSVRNVISFELREGIDLNGDLYAMLRAYLAGPEDPALVAPVGKDVSLLSATLEDNKVTLTFSQSFGQLSALDRSIACAAISMTCMEFTGAEAVEIFGENLLFDGEASILITRDVLLTEDDTPITEP